MKNATQHAPAATPVGFAAKITRDSALVYDLRLTLNGEARFFIIQVPRARREAFLAAVEKDTGFRLEDFGEILHRGWDEPPEELKAQLRAAYGMYADEAQGNDA
jgi:hypothetical protein